MRNFLFIMIVLLLPINLCAQGQITRNNKSKNNRTPSKTILTHSNPTGIVNNHEAIDLGLSVRWASCNIGANNPEEYGSYFVLGDIEPKENTNYIETAGSDENILRGITSIAGNPKYDACTSMWGAPWRSPSKKEYDELVNKCKWEWSVINGISGVKITGPNGQSIFLPAAGFLISATKNPQLNKQGFYGTTNYTKTNCSLLNFGLTIDAGNLFKGCDSYYRKTGANPLRAVTK